MSETNRDDNLSVDLSFLMSKKENKIENNVSNNSNASNVSNDSNVSNASDVNDLSNITNVNNASNVSNSRFDNKSEKQLGSQLENQIDLLNNGIDQLDISDNESLDFNNRLTPDSINSCINNNTNSINSGTSSRVNSVNSVNNNTNSGIDTDVDRIFSDISKVIEKNNTELALNSLQITNLTRQFNDLKSEFYSVRNIIMKTLDANVKFFKKELTRIHEILDKRI